MTEETQVADYFVVAGLPDDPQSMDDYTDATPLVQNHSLAPITDITVIFPSLNEVCPDGWQILDHTPSGLMANLNYGSLHSPEAYICYKRGRHKPPLVDIGVLYENKDRILSDSEIVLKTPYDRIANVNNANTKTFITYRRARKDMPANELVVTNICVIITSKGEKAPHAFCVIKKNLNKGIFSQDVFLCYKKSMNRAHLISYKPGILCRYPSWDRSDWKLHSNVPLFCLPMGATLEVWPPEASQPAPVFSTFVLTVSDAAEKIYGSAVTFYERYPVEKLTEEQLSVLEKSIESEKVLISSSSADLSEKSLDLEGRSSHESLYEENMSASRRSVISDSHTFNVNKCICLLSHWPFFDTFEKFLRFLYKLSTTGPHAVPIERYISHFLENVPFPSPQRPRIQVQLSAKEKVVLYQPEDIPLPRSGAGFRELLNLNAEDYLLVLLLVLTEHKILVHSLRSNVLTSVVEALSMIIFPFKWQCPYIPLCPLGLAEVLHAPVPFLIGVDSRFFDLYEPPPDVTCIDLDTNNITLSEEKKNLSYKLLPKKAAKNLRNTLEILCEKCETNNYVTLPSLYDDDSDDGYFRISVKDKQKMELEIQEAFLRFMATILKGYRSYLLPIIKAPTVGTTDPKSLFDLQGFLKSRDKSDYKFFVMLMKTQMFIRFIEERSFVSDMDASLAFFDECTEKVEDTVSRLLEFDEYEEYHKSERTVFIPPPELSGLPSGTTTTYRYQGFNLDNTLFKNKDKSTLKVPNNEIAPGSPMARRTKHEVKSAQKLARRKHSQSPQSWAVCLLTTCYSLWFIHLPSFVINDSSKSSACLRIAYDLLVKIQKLQLHPTDEVCYRVMMQLFGLYSQPVLAVNLLSKMKACGIQPNALTYGYYNRAVLEATWPSDQSHPTQLWSKLRNVIVGVALFRRGVQRAKLKLSEAESCLSIASLEKGDFMSELEKVMRKRQGNIMKPQQNLQELLSCQTLESSAGILMTCLKKSPSSKNFQKKPTDFNAILQQGNSSVANDVNAVRLRRGSMSPTISENDTIKLLIKCDSFANDTSILEKLNRANKLAENSGNLTSKASLVPQSSSESLDITDDNSLDDSWNDCKNEKVTGDDVTDIPTKNLISKLNCLESDWKRKNSNSHYSIDCTPHSACDNSEQNCKMKNCEIGKPPWKGCDIFLTPGQSPVPSQVPNQRCPGENNQEQHCQDKTYSRSNQIETVEQSYLYKTSPIRTPVTENDPLGALRSKHELDKKPKEISEAVEARNTLDNSKGTESRMPSTKMKYDFSSAMLASDSSSKAKEVYGDRINLDYPDESSANRFRKSATFNNGGEEESRRVITSKCTDTNGGETFTDHKVMQRSTTMPYTARSGTVPSASSVASSFSTFSSNFKFSFSRYSPSRFSLKKSDLRISKTQILENALSGSKKSNELLLSGFNTVKSAASSVAKKIEEVISTNTTPMKSYNISHDFEDEEGDYGSEKNVTLDFESWGTNLKEFFGDGSRKGSSANLQPHCIEERLLSDDVIAETLYGKNNCFKNIETATALVIVMTTCCKCSNCCSILHDEEIIAGWTPDDSNLNTKCHFCAKPTLPFLSVAVYDHRNEDKHKKCSTLKSNLAQNFINRHKASSTSPMNARNADNKDTFPDICQIDAGHLAVKKESDACAEEKKKHEVNEGEVECPEILTNLNGNVSFSEKIHQNKMDPHVLEPIIVPYLNPLVLRKELENILHHEGDQSLTKSSFVDQHPIVYWNMVWVFERISFTSHLSSLTLHSSVVKKNQFIHPSWASDCDATNVSVKCLWDNPRLYEEVGQPMYMLWHAQNHQSPLVDALITDRVTIPRSVIENIITNLRRDKLYESMRILINERTKLRRSHSLYRDILFLAIAVCDRANIILDTFDREYTISYERLRAEETHLLDCDKPPVSASFRNYFRPLLLSHQIN